MEKYKGDDYTNVYGTDEYNEIVNKFAYVEKEEYLDDEKDIEITDGFSLHVKEYIHMSERAVHAEMAKAELHRDGECIFRYTCIDLHDRYRKELIRHSNGHRYYPFHTDLYGISYIDVDTLEVYNYIPTGRYHTYDAVCGESFIIIRVHYDPKTDLVAYEGCIWAGPSDVMVGDLSDPLNFDPHLFSIHDIIDPDYEECGDIDFVRWTDEGIEVMVDEKKTQAISFEEIRNACVY